MSSGSAARTPGGPAPWLRPDALRELAPARAGHFGVLRAGEEGALPARVPDLDALRRAVGPGRSPPALFAWTPEDRYLRTVYELDELADRVQERGVDEARRTLRRAWPKAAAAGLLAVGAVLLWPQSRDLQLLVVLGAVFLFAPLWSKGVEASLDAWAGLRRLRRDPAQWRRRQAERLRFDAWSTAGRSRTGYAVVVACAAVFALQLVAGNGAATAELALVKPRVRDGEWWRLFTCTLLHANYIHIYFNLVVAAALAGMASRLVSESHLLFTWLASGIAGSLASLALTSGSSVGASGAILGWGGLLTGLGLVHPDVRRTGILGRMLRWVLLLGLIGLAGSGIIDNAAHGGGFAAGLLLGMVFGRGGGWVLPIGGSRLGPAYWVLAALGAAEVGFTLVVLLRLATHG